MEKIKTWIGFAESYIPKMTVMDMGMVKICLLALGAMLGIVCPKKVKKPVLIVCAVLFTVTYIPVMVKFIKHGKSCCQK